MSERDDNDCANDADRIDDAVDPRVQIELERLNTATDDINKLEVDLDEARATFRELLCDSTVNIDNLAKKLGSCIEKSRPYYDARFKAKEALREAQKAAIRFERANGQHAAAKEMVYLAEEGLKTEGRCFDHAWQEMLNHATSRVNESEHERALSEAEHRHTTAIYHKAEHSVQRLQRELKRAIAKSSMDARRSLLLINSIAYRHDLLMLPYYEMKAQFNQMLEEQKTRVSLLERSVGEAKMTYAEALRNLEKISDEIHRTRRYDGLDDYSKHQETAKETKKSGNATAARNSSDSSITGSPDSTDYTSDEYLRLPDKMSPNVPCPVPKTLEKEASCAYLGLSNLNLSSTEPRKYIKRERPRSMATVTEAKTCLTSNDTRKTSSSSSRLSDLAKVISPTEKRVTIKTPSEELAKTNGSTTNGGEKLDSRIKNFGNDKMASSNPLSTQNGDEWTEISLNNSPDEVYYNNEVYSDDDDQIPYKPLPSELSPDSAGGPGILSSTTTTTVTSKLMAGSITVVREDTSREKRKTQLVNQISLPAMMESNESSPENSTGEPGIISTTTTTTTAPKLMAGGVITVRDDASRERKKPQLINQKSMPAMMETNELSLGDGKKAEVTRSPSIKGRSKLDGSLANWISRSSAAGETSCNSSVNSSRRQSLDMLWSTGTVERAAELLSHGIMMLDIGNLSERFRGDGKNAEKPDKPEKGDKLEVKGKKVPSPLEKTMTYLNPDEETSDSESLASVEMLSEDQISSLMMEQDMNQVCQEILGTPLVEVCPLLQQLQQQQ